MQNEIFDSLNILTFCKYMWARGIIVFLFRIIGIELYIHNIYYITYIIFFVQY